MPWYSNPFYGPGQTHHWSTTHHLLHEQTELWVGHLLCCSVLCALSSLSHIKLFSSRFAFGMVQQHRLIPPCRRSTRLQDYETTSRCSQFFLLSTAADQSITLYSTCRSGYLGHVLRMLSFRRKTLCYVGNRCYQTRRRDDARPRHDMSFSMSAQLF